MPTECSKMETLKKYNAVNTKKTYSTLNLSMNPMTMTYLSKLKKHQKHHHVNVPFCSHALSKQAIETEDYWPETNVSIFQHFWTLQSTFSRTNLTLNTKK